MRTRATTTDDGRRSAQNTVSSRGSVYVLPAHHTTFPRCVFKFNTIVRVNRRAGEHRVWFTSHCRDTVADISHAAAARGAFIRAVFVKSSLISARDVDGTVRLLNIKQWRLTEGASESSSVPVQKLGSVRF